MFTFGLNISNEFIVDDALILILNKPEQEKLTVFKTVRNCVERGEFNIQFPKCDKFFEIRTELDRISVLVYRQLSVGTAVRSPLPTEGTPR